MMYPNVYAGDSSVTNLSDISAPVATFLEDYAGGATDPFAFSTETAYNLVLPETKCTKCLIYEYSTKRWNVTTYPVVFSEVILNNLSDIRMLGTDSNGNVCEYHFNKTFEQAYGEYAFGKMPYGDILFESENGVVKDLENYFTGTKDAVTITPIAFELDTGQKSDQILTKKQFVETKIVIATNDHAPAIDMDCTIHIGGNASIITKDISTDSAFWNKEAGGIALNTSGTGLGDADAKNILRQLVLRYSGKGNSIRHIITGKSLSNFSLYETYVRYKLLNVKQ
jgi:hypothetical protein